jgi:glycerophosphoryl diester phosphodiesterase
LADFYLDRPLNFAHRGASHEAPENALAAFLLAIDLGADGIELDVQLSKDGELVVIHDFALESTTNGQGPVSARTLAELRELDAGSWFDPVFAGQRIPTLQEVIDGVGDHLLLNIELKTASLRDDGLAAAVVRAIEDNRLLVRVIVSSFNPLAVWRVKRLNPWIATGLLYSPDMPFFLRRPWLRRFLKVNALHPDYKLVDSDYVPWAKRQGYRVNVWTTDDPGEMWQLLRKGVDAIITNRPDVLTQVLMATRGKRRSMAQRLLSVPAPEGV